MMSHSTYPSLPSWGHTEGPSSAPPLLVGPSDSVAPQVPYHLRVINAKRGGLIDKEKMFKKKYKKYNKILN